MIYFDNNATTRIDPEAREAMLPYLDDAYGNPNSAHQAGNRTRVAVERARGQTARALGVTPSEIVFTGGGSESDNTAIIGALLAHASVGANLVTSAIEHSAVGATCAWAAKRFGFELRVAPLVIHEGAIDPRPFIDLIDDNTALVTVMAASNETGVVMPLAPIFARAHEVGAICHTDAVQAFGKLPGGPRELGADLLSLSAHKFHGPKGVGVLYIRRGVAIEPLIHGGSQESARRAGTENVANIVGLGKAAELAVAADPAHLAALRDGFEARLLDALGDRVKLNFAGLPRTPNTSSVCVKGGDGNLLLIKLDRLGLCVSTGAACSSGSLKPSSVLLESGLSEADARATLRISFSRFNTETELDEAVAILTKVVA